MMIQKNWVHEVQAILEASRYRPISWVSLAAMQLREEAATWWRSLDTDPWQMIWSEFTEMFLAQFPPPTYPRGPSTRITDAVARLPHNMLFLIKSWRIGNRYTTNRWLTAWKDSKGIFYRNVHTG